MRAAGFPLYFLSWIYLFGAYLDRCAHICIEKDNWMPVAGKTVDFRAVDLFAGCGGMSKGFENAGYYVSAAFEFWKPAIDVYRANFSHPVVEQDLSRVDESVEKIRAYEPDIIIGGPPCQDFSTAGYQDETRGRAILSVCYARIVTAVMPRYFVMENVATIRNTESFRKAIATFKEAGYGLTQKVLNAAYCGVPQTR